MSHHRERALGVLMALNLVLQLFDGLATYAGLRAGFGEANPFVAWAIALVGPEAALSLVKAQACVCLWIVWTLRRRSALAAPALLVAATVYLAMSVGPWSVALAPLYIPSS